MELPEQIYIDHFHKQVTKTDTCWLWTGYRAKGGHGQFRFKSKNHYVHRLAYLFHHKTIDDSLCVCHKCDNPICVNPDHLFLGTMSENMKDKIAKNRHAKGDNGMLSILSEDNVIEIMRLYKTGQYSQAQLGRRFKIGQTQISRIVNGHRWGHITAQVGTIPAIV